MNPLLRRVNLRRWLAFGALALLGEGPHQSATPGALAAKPAPIAATAPAAAAPVAEAPVDESTGRLLQALKQELGRSMSRLRLKGYEAPYFISYTLRDVEVRESTGKFGAVFGRDHDRQRVVRVEVRVGSYDLDNTSVEESDAEGDMVLSLTEVSKDAPLDRKSVV